MGRVSSRVLRERANLSFCIVVIFFAIFSVILLTEILLIDQTSRSRGRRTQTRLRNNYEENIIVAQHGEEYLLYQGPLEETDGRFGRQSYAGSNHQFSPNPVNNLTAKDGQWQSVSGTRYKFFVFSAFYDWRGTRIIRVMGATKTRGPDRVWCVLWYQGANTTYSVTVPAKVKVIRENWNLKYSACFIICTLKVNLSVPQSVSIMSRARVPLTNKLIVNHQYNDSRSVPVPPKDKIGVCVKPLHFDYNQTLQMLEFIELNSLLGMNHITFYNDTISSTTNCILNHYLKEGRVTVLPWRLDMVSQREIRTEGLFAALNDCLYRSMYNFSHIALIDLDEIIMPKHQYTIQQFLDWMGNNINTKSTGSYSFQNAFFYLQWPDDGLVKGVDVVERSLTTLRKTRRRAKLHPHKQRSKYICRPEFVIEAGNHFVWEFVPGHGTLNVPSDVAILNHYRVCEFGGDDCIKSPSVVDRTAYKYRESLVERIRNKWEILKRECSLPDIETTIVKRPKKISTTNKTR